MRKAILLLLLAVVSGSAGAEWVEVGSSEIDVIHVDPATIRKAGNRVKMWHLMDFKTAQKSLGGKSYMSSKTQREYDCKEEQSSIRYFSYHFGNMGEGEVVYSDSSPGTWKPIPPGSGTEILWKFACGKR